MVLTLFPEIHSFAIDALVPVRGSYSHDPLVRYRPDRLQAIFEREVDLHMCKSGSRPDVGSHSRYSSLSRRHACPLSFYPPRALRSVLARRDPELRNFGGVSCQIQRKRQVSSVHLVPAVR
jgi:hypothetical protein